MIPCPMWCRSVSRRVVLIYSYALSGQGMFGVAVMFAYVAMGAVRLARFNATVSTSDSKYFTGLAIPAAAGVIASLVISIFTSPRWAPK